MTVRVKLHGILRKFLPPGSEDHTAVLELDEGAAVADAIARLGIPTKHASMLVSGDDYLKPETQLRDGQEISVFPPLAGGLTSRAE